MAGYLVVIGHGVGATGHDMAPLADALASAMPDAIFVTPDAPEEYDLYPGMGGRQWFSLADRSPAVIALEIRRTRPAFDICIDAALARHGLPADAYALVGFSQGAMMALHAGLRRSVAPRAIVAISGALLDRASLTREVTHKPPVLLIHGGLDQVVPPGASREAARHLATVGITAETLFRPTLGHAVDDEGLAACGAFLAKHCLETGPVGGKPSP